MSFLDRPWSFWYTVLYATLMTVFGLQAVKRWGLDRKDKFQIWRFVSLSCIGCGICVSACPMDVLSFGPEAAAPGGLVQLQAHS